MYWTEEVDTLFKIYTPLLKHLYDKNSGSTRKPGEGIYMTRGELTRFFEKAHMFTDTCGEN